MVTLPDYDDEDLNKFGRRVLSKYGRRVCEASEQINTLSIPESTKNTYKPQIRQVLNECGDIEPTPQSVWDAISTSDKSSSTKRMMVSAMAKYYKAIDKPRQTATLRDLSKSGDIESGDITEEPDYITRNELDDMVEYLLPDNDEKTKTLSFQDKRWVTTLQHKCLILMLYHTTCTVGEFCQQDESDECLKTKDIEKESNQIRIYKKQNDKYNRKAVKVPSELIDALSAYIREYGIDGKIFDFSIRTAQNRLSDIDSLYEYALGNPKNADKITPSVISRSKSQTSQQPNTTDKLTEIYNLLDVDTHDEALTEIQNNLN